MAMAAPNWLSKQTIALLNENAKTECHRGKFADITFIVGKDKKEFPSIRGIFAMQCPYFATKLYSECEVSYGQKIIEDDINITEAGFKFIHELFYRLDPLITAENVIDVLYAANKYSLRNLAADCNSFIDAIYTSTEYNSSIVNILLFETRAIQLNLKVNHAVRQRFQNWLTVETSHQIIKSKAFLLAPKELIIQIIQNDSFSVKEEDIWIGCKEWCTYQIQIQKEWCRESKIDVEQEMTWHALMRENFVKHIRFGLIPKQFFVKNVYPSNVLSIEESMKITLHFMDSSTKIDYNVNHRHKVNYDFKTELEIMKSQLDIYKNAQVLQYKLEVSSKYKGFNNTYEGLTNNNVNIGVATNNSTNEYVVANFTGKQQVVRMDIGGSGAASGCGVNYLNNRTIQYKDDSGNWADWKVITNLQQDVISVMDVDIKTNALRIFDNAQRHIFIGCWRFYGTDIDGTTFEDLLSDGPSTKRRKLNNFAQGWYCSACTLENPDLDCLKCSLCETPRTFTEKIKYPAVHPVILPLDDDDDDDDDNDDNEEKENDNTQNSLTFITWNVWFEEGIQVIERMKAIGNIIDNHNADIVCFQEITPFILDILQNGDWYTKNGYSSTILPSHGMFEGLSYFNVIMTRHEFIRDAIQFKYFTNTQMGRHLIITPIQFKCNATSQLKIVYAATSHLESPVGPWEGGKKDKFSAERKEQLRYSLQVLDDHKICDNNNVIFGGDFNWCRQTKNNENDGDLNKYLNGNWIDCWDKVHRNDRDDGYTYDAKTNGMLSGNLRNRLDLIVYKHNSDLKLKSCEMIGTEAIPWNGTQEKVLPVLPSDHYGLVAKFDID